MKFKIVTIDILDGGEQQRTLNAFLASHPVYSVTRELIRTGGRAYWAFCIEHGDPGQSSTREQGIPGGGSQKPTTDYRKELSDEQYEQFTRFREWRAETAEREGIQLYNVLYNAQIAEIVRGRMTTVEQLKTVKGLGESKLKKYGDALLSLGRELFTSEDDGAEASSDAGRPAGEGSSASGD